MTRAALAALALAFTLAHLPYLASSLDDIDSVNFALGLRDFDVATHRPHPPGYPAYIALGKLGVPIVAPLSGAAPRSVIDARTLSILSLVGSIGAILGAYALTTSLYPTKAIANQAWRRVDVHALAVTVLAVTCPLFWYLAVRPMSDVPGLAAALAAQAALALAWWRQRVDSPGDGRLSPDRMASSGAMIVLGALLAGLAIGFRSQNAALTLPFLAGVLLDRIGRGVAGAMLGAGMALTVGVLLCAVPLVLASGGLDAYLAALGSQAGEDFAGGEMLSVNPSPRLAAFALMRTFIYPWDSVALGVVMTTLAGVGALTLLWRDRRSLMAVILLSVPYLLFHLLFQDTAYVRYALPLMPAVAFLAVSALDFAGARAVIALTGLLAAWSVAIAFPVIASYGGAQSPTARVVIAMENEARTGHAPGALAMHQTFRRPLEAEESTLEPRLASPARREWLELVQYWRDGHTAPVWFLADPRRTDIALFDPRSLSERVDFVWPFASLSDIGGMRPRAVSWYRMPAPGWFAEEGWALTPETAGMARLMGRGPSIGPITAWVRRRPDPVRMVIGGRHLGRPGDPPARFLIEIDGSEAAAWESAAGFFLHDFELPAGAIMGSSPLARLSVRSTSISASVPTAIEQFDLQTRGTLMWAYDEGWHEAEYEPARGVWRWTSDRATLRILDASRDLNATFHVERPRRYFDDDPSVRVVAGNRLLAETNFRDTDQLSVVVPLDALQAAGGRLTIETNRTFVPAERGGPPDRRRLGLRVFRINIASQP